MESVKSKKCGFELCYDLFYSINWFEFYVSKLRGCKTDAFSLSINIKLIGI